METLYKVMLDYYRVKISLQSDRKQKTYEEQMFQLDSIREHNILKINEHVIANCFLKHCSFKLGKKIPKDIITCLRTLGEVFDYYNKYCAPDGPSDYFENPVPKARTILEDTSTEYRLKKFEMKLRAAEISYERRRSKAAERKEERQKERELKKLDKLLNPKPLPLYELGRRARERANIRREERAQLLRNNLRDGII